MGFTVEDIYLIISYMFVKDVLLVKMIKKIDNIGTIKRLPGSEHLQRTNMHFSRISYLIMTEGA